MSEQAPTADILRSKEAISPRINRVTFGHWAHDYDLDQAATMFLASQARMYNSREQKITDIPLLTTDARIEFTPVPAQKDLDDSNTLVIEGIPRNEPKKNSNPSANFDNFVRDGKEFPAAEAFAQAFNRELGGANAAKISEFRNWFKAWETKQPFTGTLKQLNQKNLEAAARFFDSLKDSIIQNKGNYLDYRRTLVEESNRLFEKVFASGQIPLEEFDTDAYEKYENAYNVANLRREINKAKLEEQTQKPEALQFASLVSQDPESGVMHNYQIAYFDVRGLKIDKGGIEKALDKASSRGITVDVVMLIDEERNDDDTVVGTKMILRNLNENSTDKPPINLEDVAVRLHQSEAVFGKGQDFVSRSDYGGHTFLLSTPRGGSDLNPSVLWGGIQEHVTQRRYSESEWKSAVQALADKINCVTFEPEGAFITSEDNLAKRQANFHITINGEIRTISLSEDELPYYAAICAQNNDVEKNIQIFAQRKSGFEAPEITALKQQRAQESLNRRLAEGSGLNILYSLDSFQTKSIEKLPLETKMQILRKISRDSTAIAAIWDKDDTRFGIPPHELRDWMIPGSEAYKKATYDFSSSLSKKVDRHVIDSIYEQLLLTPNETELEAFGTMLTDVISSPAYRSSHEEQSYDNLLQSTLRFVAEKKIPATLRQTVATRLVETYAEAKPHWQRLAKSHRLLLYQTAAESPAVAGLLEKNGIDPSVRKNEKLPRAVIVDPTYDGIKSHSERQKSKEAGDTPYLTIFVEIGRPIRDLISREGILRLEKDETGIVKHEEDIEFDGEISMIGTLIQNEREGKEATYLSDEVIRMIRELNTQNPDAKIRIIRGGFSNFLSARLTERILRHGKFSDDVLKKIVNCDWEMQQKYYYDVPLLSEDEEDTTD